MLYFIKIILLQLIIPSDDSSFVFNSKYLQIKKRLNPIDIKFIAIKGLIGQIG